MAHLFATLDARRYGSGEDFKRQRGKTRGAYLPADRALSLLRDILNLIPVSLSHESLKSGPPKNVSTTTRK